MNSLKTREYVLALCVFGIVVLFLYGLGSALIPLLFASFAAYASLPVIKKLEKQNFSRNQSAFAVLTTATLMIALLLFLAIPPLFNELRDALIATPKNLAVALSKVDAFLSGYGVDLPYDKASLVSFISESSEKISSGILASGAQWIKNSLANFVSVVVALLSLTMIPVFFFYVLTDYEKITNFIFELLPRSWRPHIDSALAKTDEILSGYIRGQLLVCIILSVLYTSSLVLVGVPFALVIGVTTGVLSIIPYVGFSLGFGLAIISVLASDDSWWALIFLIIAYSLVQFVESFVITPRIVGDKVGLAPFEAILFLIIFGNLFGFIGLFIAIPTGAILKYLAFILLKSYKKTSLYKS